MTANQDSQTDWVLMGIVFGGGEQQASIESIISAADYVNHAIIKFDELCAGLIFLLKKGIVHTRGTDFKLSERIVKRYQSIKGYDTAKYWRVTREIIIESSSQPDIQLHTSQVVKKSDYEKAVREYMERNRVE